jgi:predicted  nucleic acid-binding Zn-ribbon protein
MLKELLEQLQALKDEVESFDPKQLPEDQQASKLMELAEKVLNKLENANIEIPDEHSDDSGIEVPTSEL